MGATMPVTGLDRGARLGAATDDADRGRLSMARAAAVAAIRATRRSRCCASPSPSRRSRSASTSSSTSSSTGRSTWRPGSTTSCPAPAQQFMYFVGVTEIVAGVAVALKPRYGAYVVAAWLGGIIVNLLTYSGYYDIALRDFGLHARSPHARPAGGRLRPAAAPAPLTTRSGGPVATGPPPALREGRRRRCRSAPGCARRARESSRGRAARSARAGPSARPRRSGGRGTRRSRHREAARSASGRRVRAVRSDPARPWFVARAETVLYASSDDPRAAR